MTELHHDLRRLLADRHGPEATAIFRTLLAFVSRRVARVAHGAARGLLTEADREEVIGEVMFQLMEGALGRFRGESMGELLAYVRTMTDRVALRRGHRRLRERDTVHDLFVEGAAAWTPEGPDAPDAGVEFDADSPLDAADQTYLEDLVHAGSKAALARQRGVSRAAVTQRVGRILSRVESLDAPQKAAHEAWLERVASDALDPERTTERA